MNTLIFNFLKLTLFLQTATSNQETTAVMKLEPPTSQYTTKVSFSYGNAATVILSGSQNFGLIVAFVCGCLIAKKLLQRSDAIIAAVNRIFSPGFQNEEVIEDPQPPPRRNPRVQRIPRKCHLYNYIS